MRRSSAPSSRNQWPSMLSPLSSSSNESATEAPRFARCITSTIVASPLVTVPAMRPIPVSVVAELALMGEREAEIFHQRPGAVDQEAQRLVARVEILMPGEGRDRERIACLDLVGAVLDDGAALARKDVVDLV